MEKSSIKRILKNWTQLRYSNSFEVMETLIPIEDAILDLKERNIFNREDILILEAFRDGYNYSEISRLFGMSRQTVSSRINRICTAIVTELK